MKIPFDFSLFECAILTAIIIFVIVMLLKALKDSGKNGGPRWGA
jgi:hypothetical protein